MIYVDFETALTGFNQEILVMTYIEGDGAPQMLQLPEMEDIFKIINKHDYMVSHNVAFELQCLKDLPQCKIHCTYLLSKLAFWQFDKFKFDVVINTLYGQIYDPIEKTSLQKSDWSGNLTQAQIKYAYKDVIYLKKLFDEHLKAFTNVKCYVQDIQAVIALHKLTQRGIPISFKRKDNLVAYCYNELHTLPFNVNSSIQVCRELGTPDNKAETLLASTHPLAEKVIHNKKHLKIISFLKKYTDPVLRGKFLLLPITGRTCCLSHNLQQITKKITEIYYAKGKYFVYADFPQLELYCAAKVMGIRTFLDKLKLNIDLHTYTAEQLYNTTYITPEQRQIGKNLNFQLLYGIGVRRLFNFLTIKLKLKITLAEVSALKVKWFNLYPEIRVYHNKAAARLAQHLPILTDNGRRMKPVSYNTAINYASQSLGAQIALKSLIDIQDLPVINFVHDSFLLLADTKKQAQEYAKSVETSMQNSYKTILDVDKKVEAVITYEHV